MTGGEIIREARLRAGLSQRDLAERLGTSQSVVARWENGSRSPDFESVVRAVRACGLELHVTIGTPDDQHEALVRASRRLPPHERLEQVGRQRLGIEDLVRAAKRGRRGR